MYENQHVCTYCDLALKVYGTCMKNLILTDVRIQPNLEAHEG